MHLIHYRHDVPNFGDDLNLDLWPELAPNVFADPDDGQGFIGIGTIIGMPFLETKRLHIFSSGTGYSPLEAWADKIVTYHCVRGPVSARLLGLDPALAITDGAILTPLVSRFPARAGGGGGTIVIPHYQTLAFPGWSEACAQAGFTLVDPRGTPEQVIAAIAGADHVLTESLHGAILADCYGIPWSAFATSNNFSTTKWVDWLASLDMDVRLTILPPPCVDTLFAFGRRPESWGHVLQLGLEDAAGEFETRMATWENRNRVRDTVKAIVRRTPLRRLLGFTPARTAAALTALSKGPTQLSNPQRRETLRGRMVDKLAALNATM